MKRAQELTKQACNAYDTYFRSCKPHYVNGCHCYSEGHLPGTHGRATLTGLAAFMWAEILETRAYKLDPRRVALKPRKRTVPTLRIY